MKGLRLDLLKVDLKKVSPRYKRPISAIRNIDKKFFGNYQLIRKHFGISSFVRDSHKLPLGAFTGFDFDELCKIMYSSCMVDESIERFFQKHYQYKVIEKIWSSMQQWGRNAEGAWNEIVDTYECIRHFKFGGYKDFEIRLDHTTGHNRKGLSKHTRTCLDGVFAFLVYYKGEHVMTIGFSFIKGKILLLQQVQLVKRRKNRFLYKLPNNHLEFVIDLFMRNFPEHQLYLVDGISLIENILIEYQDGLAQMVEDCDSYKKWIENNSGGNEDLYMKWQEEHELALIVQKNKIRHLKKEAPRLYSFYSNTGKYTLDKNVCIRKHNLSHYAIMS